jgi:hypothetical protein
MREVSFPLAELSLVQGGEAALSRWGVPLYINEKPTMQKLGWLFFSASYFLYFSEHLFNLFFFPFLTVCHSELALLANFCVSHSLPWIFSRMVHADTWSCTSATIVGVWC